MENETATTSAPTSVHFLVQGSAPEPYVVTFERQDAQLRCVCSCDAGVKGMHCKHRLNILAGQVEGIVSPNSGDVPHVTTMLEGTLLAAALADVAAADAALDRAKKDAAAARKKLGRLMAG
jgi:hypothetical protein